MRNLLCVFLSQLHFIRDFSFCMSSPNHFTLSSVKKILTEEIEYDILGYVVCSNVRSILILRCFFYLQSPRDFKKIVKEVAMELISEDKLIQDFSRFLESKKSNLSESTYTEFNLFTDIQYLKILESQLEQCKKENEESLEKCKNSSTKVVSTTYTVLTPTYLKRTQRKVLETIKRVQEAISVCLDHASQYAGLVDTNCWFEWWQEYMDSLTNEEYKYIADCKKQSHEPISIQPHKSLEQFVLEQKNRLTQSKQFQKNYITSEIA